MNLSLDGAAAALLERLERQCPRLGDWLETHEGIHSGNMRRRLFVQGGAADPCLRPMIFGRDEIRPFRLRWAGRRVVYDRDAIRRDRGDYANLGRRHWFTSPKILVRRTGDRIVAALDREGFFASNNLFVALAKPGCPVPLEYLEGYLNSSLATWCFRALQPRAGRLFAELKLSQLNMLPVPSPSSRREIATIESLGRKLRERRPGQDLAGGMAALDAAFMKLAGLTPSEAAQVSRENRFTRRASSL
jgi:hypothetical protein